jgi:predicted DNA repair protein MutK
MDTLWALLDMSAQARGYVSSCTHDCSPSLLSVIGGIVLVIGAIALVTTAVQEAYAKRDLKSVAAMLAWVLFAAASLVGALFVGPVLIILGIVGLGFAWHKLFKPARSE